MVIQEWFLHYHTTATTLRLKGEGYREMNEGRMRKGKEWIRSKECRVMCF
jgi:hypothetical protein